MDDPFAKTDEQVLHGLSPDRTSILLTNFMGLTAELEFGLWLLPVVGGAPRFLGEGTDGAYSPDGTKLLYTDGYDDVYQHTIIELSSGRSAKPTAKPVSSNRNRSGSRLAHWISDGRPS